MERLRGFCASNTLPVSSEVTSASQHLCDVVTEDLRDESVRAVGLAEERRSHLAAPGVQLGDVEDAIVSLELRRLEHRRALSVRNAEADEVDGEEVLGPLMREQVE